MKHKEKLPKKPLKRRGPRALPDTRRLTKIRVEVASLVATANNDAITGSSKWETLRRIHELADQLPSVEGARILRQIEEDE